MCAPISATIGGSITSASFATAMLFNQILAIATIVSLFGYKIVRFIKSV